MILRSKTTKTQTKRIKLDSFSINYLYKAVVGGHLPQLKRQVTCVEPDVRCFLNVKEFGEREIVKKNE